MLPRLHSSTITHLLPEEFRKVQPAISNKLPEANTKYALVTFFVHQLPQTFPYFASITFLHKASVSMPYLHNHLPNKAELILLNRLIPSPPTCTSLQILAHFPRCNLGSPLIPLQRKSLCNFSM